jgi:hypothetical protein
MQQQVMFKRNGLTQRRFFLSFFFGAAVTGQIYNLQCLAGQETRNSQDNAALAFQA